MLQENKVTGRKADVVLAAHNAAEVALRMVKPGAEVLELNLPSIFLCREVKGWGHIAYSLSICQ